MDKRLTELKTVLNSFFNGTTKADYCYNQVKNIIKKGEMSIDFKKDFADILGTVVKDYLLNQKKWEEVLKTDEFKSLIQGSALEGIDANYIKGYINNANNIYNTAKGINEQISTILTRVSYIEYVDKIVNADNGVDALSSLFSLVETVSGKVPLVGKFIELQACVANKCLEIASGYAKHYNLKLTALGDALLGIDAEDYQKFNGLLDQWYGGKTGGKYIKELYMDQATFQQKVGRINSISELNPIELYFLYSYGKVFKGYFLNSLGEKAVWDLSSSMNKYSEKMLQQMFNKYYCREQLQMIINQLTALVPKKTGVVGSSSSVNNSYDDDDDDTSNSIGHNRPNSGGGSTSNSGGGSTTNPGGGSTTNPGGGSTTNPGGGSATNPGGGSATNPGGGSTTNPGGGSTSNSGVGATISSNGNISGFFGNTLGNIIQAAQKIVMGFDPIIFDLNNDGIFSSGVEDGVFFDYEGDGFAERTAWMSEGDGMLVRDINKNGIIDDGSELFGDRTLLSNGKLAKSGFEALLDLDSNEDGIINEADSAFNELKIWIDKNRDGISQSDELFTLKELGIKEINLKDKNVVNIQENSNLISGTAYAVKDNGDIIDVGELNFKKNTINTILKEEIEISEEILELPEIAGVGRVYSLRQEMMRNSRLKDLVYKFIQTEDRSLKKEMIDEILLEWTGSLNVQEGSRGGNIDAKHLSVLEAFYGTTFKGDRGENPNRLAANMLNGLYEDLKYHVYANLIFKTECKRYFTPSQLEYNINGNNTNVNFAFLKYQLEDCEIFDLECTKEDVEVIAYCLNDTRIYNGDMNIQDLLKIFKTDSVYFDSICKGLTNGGNEGNYLKGTEDNNVLTGGSGNDIFYGGAGDDKLNGVAGDDIYVFGRNSGTDQVSDGLGNNIIYFEEGILAEDIVVTTTGVDITLSVKGGDTKVVLKNFRNNKNCQNYTIEFLDGSVWNINTNEYSLELQSEMNTTLDNEYNISLNEGSISMTDLGGNDVLSIGENMLNLIFERDGNNLVINSISNDNALTINDWYTSEDYQIEKITSVDGYQITNKQVQLLIDEMSSFTSERGISISDAYSDNYAAENIISQMWVSK